MDIIVELTGNVAFAHKLFQESAPLKKHFITANKALLSKELYTMFEEAQKNKIYIGFEASVAGGIPIINILRKYMTGNHIHEIEGIINGTCNYILTQMEESGLDFPEALKQAQN